LKNTNRISPIEKKRVNVSMKKEEMEKRDRKKCSKIKRARNKKRTPMWKCGMDRVQEAK
jgi:hypothetical protein